MKELEERIQALPPHELAKLCQWFENYRRQTLGELSEGGASAETLTLKQKSELLRRVKYAKAHPEALQSWEGTTDRIRKRLHALRSQKAGRS